MEDIPARGSNNTHDSPEKGESDGPDRSRRFPPVKIPILILAIAAAAHVLFFIPYSGVVSEIPPVGDISAKEVIAPFDFPILKSEDEFKREKETVRRNIPLVVNYVEGVEKSSTAEFESLWVRAEATLKNKGLTDAARLDSVLAFFPWLSEASARTMVGLRRLSDVKGSTVELLSDVYEDGIFSWKSLPSGDTAQLMNIAIGKKKEVIPAERVVSMDAARRKLEIRAAERNKNYTEKGRLVYEIASGFVRPNLLPDIEITEKNRAWAIQNVKREMGLVRKDQRIVDAHEWVTEEIHRKLISLAIAKSSKYSSRPGVYIFFKVLIRLALAFFFFGIFGWFVKRFVPRVWSGPVRLGLVLFVIWLPGLFALVLRIVGWPEFLTPIAFSAALTAMLFGSELAIAVSFLSALLVILAGGGSQTLFLALTMQGFVAGLAFSHLSVRRESIRPIAYTVLAGLATVAALDFLSATEYGRSGIRALSIISGGLFGPLLALAVLPAFERIAGVVTHFTLIDYANTNTQILQQLAIEAPGTFHHSIVVSNMAETAAESINADSLLAKVGALYHDIGKLIHPDYFSENLSENNPHDRLSPGMSFLVLSAHVKEGERLAKKHGLPKPVVDIVRQHHGTCVMRYFFEKAKSGDETVAEDDFRYPGPRPRTKEAAIVMLADSIEATVRSLGEIETDSLVRLIKNTTDERFRNGQLSDCDLTAKELVIIGDSFVRILEGALHKRPSLFPGHRSGRGAKSSRFPAEDDGNKRTN